MSDFQRKLSMENYRKENALKVVRINPIETFKAFLKDFKIWEQTAPGRSKWRDLINEGAVLCEEKYL